MPNIFDFFRKQKNIPENQDICMPILDLNKFKDTENKVTYEKIISFRSNEQFKELFFKGKINKKCTFNAPKDHLIIVPNLQSNLKKHKATLNYNIIYAESEKFHYINESNKKPSKYSQVTIGVPEILSLSANYKSDNLNEFNEEEYLYTNINQIEIIYEGSSSESFVNGYFEYYIIPKKDANKIFYKFN